MGCIDSSCLNIRLQTWCEVVETRKKDHILYESIDIKCLEKVNLQRKKADERLPGAGSGSRAWLQTGTVVLLGAMEIF